MLTDVVTDPILFSVLQEYGVAGLAFCSLLAIMIRQNKSSQKRIEKLEQQQELQYGSHIKDYKEMIEDYIELVKGKTDALTGLTSCLKAMKDTLDRMERKNEQ